MQTRATSWPNNQDRQKLSFGGTVCSDRMLATRESYPSVFCVLCCSRFKFQGGCVDCPSWRHRPVPSLGMGPARLVPIGEEETPQKETCVLLGREQKWKATEQQRSLRPVSLLPTV